MNCENILKVVIEDFAIIAFIVGITMYFDFAKNILSWFRTYVNDRRNCLTCRSILIVVLFSCVWGYMTIAIGETLPESSGDKNLNQGDLIQVQWWFIAGLLGLVLSIGQGFIIYVNSNIRENVRKLFEFHRDHIEKHMNEQSQVLTREIHREIDHSQLCSTCRK